MIYGTLNGTQHGKILVSCATGDPQDIAHIAKEHGFQFGHVLKSCLEMEPIRTLELKQFTDISEFHNFCANEYRAIHKEDLQTTENIFIIDWTNGLGESTDIENTWSEDKFAAQTVLMGLLQTLDFEWHQAEPPTIKRIQKWLTECRDYKGANAPTLFLFYKQPEAWQEYFEIGYERIP